MTKTTPKAQASRLRQIYKKVEPLISPPLFPRFYALFGVLVLLTTTVFWSLLSARVQISNADQLSDSYLFEHLRTFQQASFPGQHTLLIKWPLLLLVRLFGLTSSNFTGFTIALSVVTVGLFALILYRIDRRPLVFGTISLALASVLLLVPIMPYAGGLLPVNMAMLTTRNIEYVIFIASLYLFVRSPRIKRPSFWLAVVAMGLLIASDKLFLTLGVGAAPLMLIAYALRHCWSMVSLSVNWLIGLIGALLVATFVLWLINVSGLTHIVSQSTLSPYAANQQAHGLFLGVLYGLLGLFTNFGANPAFTTTIFHAMPHIALRTLVGVSGLSFIINLGLFATGLYCAWRIFFGSFKNKGKSSFDTMSLLATVLIWVTLVSLAAYVWANHYYAGDARYLAISFFTLFIAAAVYGQTKHFRPRKLVTIGVIILVGAILALPTVWRAYQSDQTTLLNLNDRNVLVDQAIKHHPVDTLVGDYWRVLPIRLTSSNTVNVTPLAGCTQPREILSSQAWQPNLSKDSFAYLLTLSGSLTNYPSCSIKQIIGSYGRPNASVTIAGSPTDPKELLLFYDRGIRKDQTSSEEAATNHPPASVIPIAFNKLSNTPCAGPSVMNIVAHQDDDLLFMNPDLLNSIAAGECVSTVYVTAGDAGGGQYYWLNRQRGSEAAYSTMLNSSALWIQRLVQLPSGEFVTIASPKGNSKIALIFMNLPDGNLKGQGFSATDFQSIAKLAAGKINLIHTADGQSAYTSTQLTSALSTLMQAYQPTEIRTQADFVSTLYPDHSDHITVGYYVKKTYAQYETQQFANQVTIPLKFYIGYPIHQMASNVSGADLEAKEAAFFAYGKFDAGACTSVATCAKTTYGFYLSREYQNSN